MNKELAAFVVIFLVLIGAGLYQANADAITPTLAQAQADLAIGAGPVQVIQKGASWILSLIGGAFFTGLAVAVFTEFKKLYRAYKFNATMKRWTPGPNAQWQAAQPKEQRLSRMDQLLLALAGRLPEQSRTKPQLSVMRGPTEDDEFDLEF